MFKVNKLKYSHCVIDETYRFMSAIDEEKLIKTTSINQTAT